MLDTFNKWMSISNFKSFKELEIFDKKAKDSSVVFSWWINETIESNIKHLELSNRKYNYHRNSRDGVSLTSEYLHMCQGDTLKIFSVMMLASFHHYKLSNLFIEDELTLKSNLDFNCEWLSETTLPVPTNLIISSCKKSILQELIGIHDNIFNEYQLVAMKIVNVKAESNLTENKINEWKLITKERLAYLVWTKPALLLSKEFGVSDSAIGKRCRVLLIPRPWRGFWKQVYSGKRNHPNGAHQVK